MDIDLSFSDSDFARAAQIRKDTLARLDREPVFTAARQTMDMAEAHQPLSASSADAVAGATATTAATSSSKDIHIKQSNANALAALKKSLSGIKSHRNNFFQETVPVADNEVCTRALVASDVAHPSIGIGEPRFAVEFNARPHNAESFKAAREVFVEGTQLKTLVGRHDDDARGGDGNPDEKKKELSAAVKIKIKIHEDSTSVEAEQIASFLKKMMPPLPTKKADIFVTEESEDDIFLNIVAADYCGRKDPLQKMIRAASRVAMKHSRSDLEQSVQPPDLFRLATMRFEVPQTFGEWLAKPDATWASFVEGLRIAFQVITRDRGTQSAHPEIARRLLREFKSKEIARVMAHLASLQVSKEVSLSVKVAPIEALLGMAVRDGPACLRRRQQEEAEARTKKDDDDDDDDDEQQEGGKEEFSEQDKESSSSTTQLEETVAAIVATVLQFGRTSTYIKNDILTQLVAKLVLGGGRGPPVDMLLKMKELFGEMDSVSIISQSGSVDLICKGVDSSIVSFIPNTVQEMVDAVKPIALAANADWKDDGDDESSSTAQRPTELKPEFFDSKYPNGFFSEKVAKVIALLRGELTDIVDEDESTILLQKPSKRTATDETGSNAGSAWDFFFPSADDDDDNRKRNDDNNKKVDADVARAVPDVIRVVQQEEDVTGINMVICDRCGVEYNASIPDSHTCESFGEQQQVVEIEFSERRPLLARPCEEGDEKKVEQPAAALATTDDDDTTNRPVGISMVKCDKCGEEWNASLPSEEQHTCAAKQQQQVVEISSGPSSRPLLAPRPPASGSPSSSPRGSARGGAPKKDKLFNRMGNTFVIPQDERTLQRIFDTWDRDRDFAISKDEFVSEYKEFEADLGVDLTDRDIDAAFKSADTNRDSRLSFREFCVFMRRRAVKQ